MKCSGRQASARENGPGSVRQRVGDDEAGQRGAKEETPVEHEVRRQAAGRACGDPEHAEHHGRGRAHDVEGPPRLRVGLAARCGDEGHGGPRHEVEEPGVGPVVDPRGIRPRVEEERHQDRRRDPEDHGDHHAGAAPRAAARRAGRAGARAARPGRTAPQSPGTRCAARERAWRTARSTTGPRKWSASCSRTAGSRWRRPAGPGGRAGRWRRDRRGAR